MRPAGLTSKIFLDSGDSAETKAAFDLLGFLDGQTTNPTLVGKNPAARQKLDNGEKFSKNEIDNFYKQVITEVSGLLPDGSVSIEVYSEATTSANDMFTQGEEMYRWIPNAHIKYPTTAAGLKAAERSVKAGMRVNMTLCFTQQQAAAVYAATEGAHKGEVFVSPFVGRLDDIDENGMDLIANIVRMYADGDGHSQVLAASIRSQQHFMQALALGADIITAPFTVLETWGRAGMPLPGQDFSYNAGSLAAIPYKELDLDQPWQSFDIHHQLTDKGIEQFVADWNALLTLE